MPRTKTTKKRGFLDYKVRYNPEVEGYGSPQQWRSEFNERMGLDAARSRMGVKDPRYILGVAFDATWAEIKKAYRKLVVEYFPEKRYNESGEFAERGDLEKFKDVQAAFEILEKEFGV